MDALNKLMKHINAVIWHEYALYVVLFVGVLFTFWSMGCQYRALTHGISVVRGKYDNKNDPGAINHFQALSAALSATVGLGNIGGVALAIALGGPGAVFWMWVVGVVGMALKTTEVLLSMLYRNIDNPEEPHGGPMFVVDKGLSKVGLPGLGKAIGGLFVVTLLVSAVTGGNMFQAWNVAEITQETLGVPKIFAGVVLAVCCAAVTLGGVKRIGSVAGRLVPFMCAVYIISALYVLVLEAGSLPSMLKLIVTSAFSPLEAGGAFVGGTMGYAFMWGLKRALFSSEAGQGSSPIAHSAAKTDEPTREAVVAGLEPFIDTIVVCTLTALVILSSGAWNRSGEASFDSSLTFTQIADTNPGETRWVLGEPTTIERDGKTATVGMTLLPPRNTEAKRIARGDDWNPAKDKKFFVIAEAGEVREETNANRYRVNGEVVAGKDGALSVHWAPLDLDALAAPPTLVSADIYKAYSGAVLTAHAFNRVTPGLGTYLIFFASWLFALSTLISWSYYGEQGVVYLFSGKGVVPYKIMYCVLTIVATASIVKTETELDNLTGIGTGIMLWVNIPIMLCFGAIAMREYKKYFRRFKSGQMDPRHEAPPIVDVIEGKETD